MQRELKEVVQVVGLTTALEIVRGWGGRWLWVPNAVTPEHPIALRIGLQPARQFVAHFKGRRLSLPTERSALRTLRNRAIFEAVQAGKSRTDVAHEFGVSRQTVDLIVIQMRDGSRAPATTA